MSNSFDHDRVSGSLPAFIDGTLAPSDAAAIEEHLASCEGCRREADAVRLLRAPLDATLTSSERVALEHRVMAGISDDGPAPVAELPQRSRWGARTAQLLGAAAAVAVLGTLFYFGSGMGGMGGDDSETSDAGGDAVQESSELSDRDDRRRKRDEKSDREMPIASADQASKGAGGGSGGTSDAAEAGFQAAPEPRFTVADDPLTAARLQKLGESSLASVRFANYYAADDAGGRNTLLERLVESAESTSGEAIASQVEECGAQVLDTEDPTIPTFGMLGELDGDPVLVLGFAWARNSSGPLDRYMVWAWEEGSCAAAVDFVEGRIETAGR